MGVFSSLALSLLVFYFLQTSTYAAKESYIVYMGESSSGSSTLQYNEQKVTKSHFDLLGSLMDSDEKVEDEMIYSYTRSMNGFAAFLTEAQVVALKDNPNVVSVFKNKNIKLHTTHSWDFLGFEKNGAPALDSLQKKANFGEDIIIANLDTGVWPESKSFNDEGMGPVPSRWKGICETGGGVKCNRKLIGARYFNKGYAAANGVAITPKWNTARDVQGHGSHTLSTAGGSFVPGANLYGFWNGTAKGGSPKARVAAYKVCWPTGRNKCTDADILAAFDAAIGDGVDVISVSLGPGQPTPFHEDGVSIGSLHAIKKGIPVIASAGNEGPEGGSVANDAPWLFTIGASTIDREISSTVALGDKKVLKGRSVARKSLPAGKFYPLIYGAEARLAEATTADAQECRNGTLDGKKVAGKIVLCLRGETARMLKPKEAQRAGAVGMILANDETTGNSLQYDPYELPAAHITFTDGQAVMEYINSTKNPTASIGPAITELGVKPSPVMAEFSSRGPSQIQPAILKPDVTAPGVDVLAANTEAVGELGEEPEPPYITMSGTSMSCPHVSGIVGLLKALHPDWSPAAIKSAIMTTAQPVDNNETGILDFNGRPATPFAYGAGHVHPNLAADPGLVYDTTMDDYLNFLCAHGYSQTKLKAFLGGAFTCPEHATFADFNYPSIAVPNLNGPVTVTRRVKNVGSPGTYTVKVMAPTGVSVVVEPSTLTFKEAGEEKIFKVTFKPVLDGMPKNYAFGDLTWSDGMNHHVKSPLAVKHM